MGNKLERPIRGLLVEDDLACQLIARMLLRRFGVDVVTASGGAEALEIVAREEFDIIFMDCQMPGLDGCATTRAVRARSSVPIVGLTASVHTEEHELGRAAGMNRVLTKPLTPWDLHAALCEAGFQVPAPAAAAPVEAPATLALSIRAQVSPHLEGPDGAFATTLVQTLLDEIRRHVAAIARLTPASDLARLRKLAHALIGCSRNLGATDLADIASDLEVAARQGNPHSVAACVVRARSELVRVEAAVEFVLKTL